MSLKAIHVLFIVLSIALTLVFGLWALRFYSTTAAVSSFVVGAGLMAYGVWFLRKTRGIEEE